jgi:hypothetical protein
MSLQEQAHVAAVNGHGTMLCSRGVVEDGIIFQ